jgi:Flp pilus assembly protein TadD
VVEAEPENQAALELLARAYFASAQLHRAEEALGRLVALAPTNGWARRALARTLERQSRAGEASQHHRVADALGATP